MFIFRSSQTQHESFEKKIKIRLYWYTFDDVDVAQRAAAFGITVASLGRRRKACETFIPGLCMFYTGLCKSKVGMHDLY